MFQVISASFPRVSRARCLKWIKDAVQNRRTTCWNAACFICRTSALMTSYSFGVVQNYSSWLFFFFTFLGNHRRKTTEFNSRISMASVLFFHDWTEKKKTVGGLVTCIGHLRSSVDVDFFLWVGLSFVCKIPYINNTTRCFPPPAFSSLLYDLMITKAGPENLVGIIAKTGVTCPCYCECLVNDYNHI